MDIEKLTMLLDINLERLDELAGAMADFIEKTVQIADKYGEDRTKTIENQCATLLQGIAVIDFDTYKTLEQQKGLSCRKN